MMSLGNIEIIRKNMAHLNGKVAQVIEWKFIMVVTSFRPIK